MTGKGKIDRKFLAHYISVGENKYERLGSDLEELSIELNAEVESKKNILGENSVTISGYNPTASVEPYYATQGTELFKVLQDIIDKRKTMDDLITSVVEVHTWEEASDGTSYKAFKDVAYIEVKSYGGDTTGYQIPFDLHYVGDRTEGTFNTATKEFTAA